MVRRRIGIIFIFSFFILFSLVESSHSNEPDFTITAPSMKYLMAFHGCSGSGGINCNDPHNHKVFLAQSNDGKSFSLVPGWQPYQGSVPTVFRRGNTIFIYNAWSDLRKIDMNSGIVHDAGVAKLTSNFSGPEQGGYVDPSIAQASDGRFVLFYLPSQLGGDPAGCGSQPSCVREIHYAIEVAGSGGTRFDPVGIATSKNLTPPNTFSDPDIFYNGTKWVLLVSEGPSTEVFTSDTLQSSYISAGIIARNSGGVPAGFHDKASGENWIYTTQNIDMSGSSVIRRSISSTGIEALTAFETVIDSNIYSALKLTTVASPSLAINDNGAPCPTCASGGNNSGNSNPSPNASPSPVIPSATVSTPPVSTPTPTVSASKISTTSKSITITCVKGKTSIQVKGTKPTCPKGYTLKK